MAALVWYCLQGLALAYLCGHTLSAWSSCSLHSIEQGLLHVPFGRTSTRDKCAFSVVGPSICNGLPLMLCSLPRILSQAYFSQLKMVLFDCVTPCFHTRFTLLSIHVGVP